MEKQKISLVFLGESRLHSLPWSEFLTVDMQLPFEDFSHICEGQEVLALWTADVQFAISTKKRCISNRYTALCLQANLYMMLLCIASVSLANMWVSKQKVSSLVAQGKSLVAQQESPASKCKSSACKRKSPATEKRAQHKNASKKVN